jgi:uncharacterized protein (TIGR04255 family)
MLLKLPEFDRPPLDEVALSAQFDPLPGFRAVHLGRFWTRIRERYPHTEDQLPLPSVMEKHEPSPASGVGIALQSGPMSTRTWFLDQSKNRLIQLQQGRFILNWRKLNDGDQYPRFSNLIEDFKHEWEAFQAFAKDESLGPVSVNQCELTYLNNIEPEGPDSLGDLSGIFSCLRPPDPKAFLPTPEFFSWSAGYRLPDGRGRLHVETNPAFRARDMRMVLFMNVTARGAPADRTDAAMRAWFDLAHEWIVRGFDELTDPRMHAGWGKKT